MLGGRNGAGGGGQAEVGVVGEHSLRDKGEAGWGEELWEGNPGGDQLWNVNKIIIKKKEKEKSLPCCPGSVDALVQYSVSLMRTHTEEILPSTIPLFHYL